MFLNVITEEQIRRDCPHNAPMTLRAFNKISPRQFNTSVNPFNPFEIPRYAPKTVGQFAKALVSQQRGGGGQSTNSLALESVQASILAETAAEDFVMEYGDEVAITLEDLGAEEEKDEAAILDIIKQEEMEEPLTRRTKQEMTEARGMGGEDTRTNQRKEDKMRRKEERREKTRQVAAAEADDSEYYAVLGGELPAVPSYTGLRGVSKERETDDELKDRLQGLEDMQSRSSTLDPIQGPSYG